MGLTDDQKQYFYEEIQRVYRVEEDLEIIFIDNEGKFGRNFYNDIDGKNYRNKLTFLTQRLQEKKLLDVFIKVVQKKYPDFVQDIVECNRVREPVGQPKIDLDHLKNLLEQKKWIEADIETTNLLLESIGPQNSVKKKTLKEINCDLLRGIDKLWRKESDGKFGFSAQKEIWKFIKKKYSPLKKEQRIELFCIIVRWYNYEDKEWLNKPKINQTSDVIFQKEVNNNTKGFLPTILPSNYWRKKIEANLISGLMKQLKYCEFP